MSIRVASDSSSEVSSNTSHEYTKLDEIKEGQDAHDKQIEDLKKEIDDLQHMRTRLKKRMEAAADELENTERKLVSAEAHLELLENPQTKDKISAPPPPGPKSLRFVDGDAFTVLGLSVIVINCISMYMEARHPDHTVFWTWINNVYLVFYVVELTLKALLHRAGLLCGKGDVVCWNWMDLLIVIFGVLDQWIAPLVIDSGAGSGLLKYFRLLRLFRLCRVCKILRIFLTSDLHWTEKAGFQGFIMGVIGFNAILIGLETDMPTCFLWWYFENALLIIFTFELFVRLRYQGWNFFCHAEDLFWNWLDFIIVAVGVLDQWLMEIIKQFQVMLLHGDKSKKDSGNLSEILMIIRMARLLRILRLVRLIRGVPQLRTLVIGIAKSMIGMGWVLVLTFTVLYVAALLLVKLVGKGFVVEYPEHPEVKDLFQNVQDTMFNLFMVMNADLGYVQPFIERGIGPKLVMSMFMIASNWAIFSILTAVVSDHMATVSAETAEEREAIEKEKKQEESLQILNSIFDQMDSDNTDTITRRDFDRMLEDDVQCSVLQEATNMTPMGLSELFNFLSTKKKGDTEPLIYRQDFIEGLKKEASPVDMRSIMGLEKRLKDLEEIIRESIIH